MKYEDKIVLIIFIIILNVMGLQVLYNNYSKELEYKDNWIYNQDLLIESLENKVSSCEDSDIITHLMTGQYSYYDLEIIYNLINKTPLIPELERYDFNFDGNIDWNDYYMLESYLRLVQ